MATVETIAHDGWAELVLNRPERRNAIDGDLAMALAADLLVAGETAFLQVGEVRQGMGAPFNIAWLRLRHPESVAAKLALTGRRFTGPELSAMGVAYACVPDEEVLPRARELAAELASYPAGAAARIKATMRTYNDASANACFDRAVAASPAAGRMSPRAVRRGE